jgi:uncharacterized membrane protein
MPYGPAPAYCFPLSEICVYLLFIICLIHSFRKGIKDAGYLIGALIFGLLLEFIDVYFLKGYTYGRFAVMLGSPPLDIPFWIGVGWGVIIYSARLFTDRLGLGILAAAALDAIIAINIDFTMDVVAYRLHMWDWGWSVKQMDPLTSDWFGIPYNNYFGWLIVVSTYSYFSRLFEKHLQKGKQFIVKTMIPIGAIAVSEIILFSFFKFINNILLEKFGITSLHRFLVYLILLIIIIILGWTKRKQYSPARLPFAAWIVPAWFHLYFFLWFFLAGFNQENKWMTIFAIANLFLGVLIHMPVISKFSDKRVLN